MKKAVFVLLIIGTCLVLLGGGIFAVAMAKNGWDFSQLANVTYEEKTFETDASAVSKINVKANTEDISFAFSEDDKIHILYYNTFDRKGNLLKSFEPSVTNGTLDLVAIRNRKWFSEMSFGMGKNFMISVPAGKELALSVDISTGDVAIGKESEVRSFTELNLKTDTGSIKLNGEIGVQQNATFKVHTGDIRISGKFTVANELKCTASTGKLALSAAITAEKVELRTSTGDVKISGTMTAPSITCKTDTGDVVATAAISSPLITVKSDTGDVKLLLAGKKDDYSCTLSTDTGSASPRSYVGGAKRVDVDVDTGNIRLTFTEQ